MSNKYMPINIDMSNRKCLVVGGGNVALRKVESLLKYENCSVTVVAPEVADKLQYYAERHRIKVEKRPYKSPEAIDFGLVIAATDDSAVSQEVYDDCRTHGVLVNVADVPKLCEFTFPAVLQRDCLTVAISTDGKAPFMSSHLKAILDTIFPEHWNKLMGLAAEFRTRVLEALPRDFEARTRCFERFVNADWKTMLHDMSSEEISLELDRMIERPE
ncbi:bifunctional precorrin-2 dehydrogenase/sirohydrochlorin ferrochelatase [candidate division GN15 bacterium]|nr:bifunctional precorrin-2 dehydrogenase/sirohydrochlorin ferrochelatase [candidate division GN15 bacterium]